MRVFQILYCSHISHFACDQVGGRTKRGSCLRLAAGDRLHARGRTLTTSWTQPSDGTLRTDSGISIHSVADIQSLVSWHEDTPNSTLNAAAGTNMTSKAVGMPSFMATDALANLCSEQYHELTTCEPEAPPH